MNVLVVYYHPEAKSFNSAMMHTGVEQLHRDGHEVTVSDLHEMNFNPISGRHNFTSSADPDYFKQQIEEIHAAETGGFSAELRQEMLKVESCDVMIWQFPLWWFGLPAPLKGWVDRIFAMGWAYGGGKFYEQGRFRYKRALLSLTTGGPREAYQPGGFNGDIHAILRPIQRGILEFVGFRVLEPTIVYGPAHLSDEQRAMQLEQWAERLSNIATEQPIRVGSYR